MPARLYLQSSVTFYQGYKYSVSIPYSSIGSQQVGKLHLPEHTNSMQGTWMDATFLAQLKEICWATKPCWCRVRLMWKGCPSAAFPGCLFHPFQPYITTVLVLPFAYSLPWVISPPLVWYMECCGLLPCFLAERFRSQRSKVQLLTLSFFSLRQLDTDHYILPTSAEKLLWTRRSGKSVKRTLQLYRKFAILF